MCCTGGCPSCWRPQPRIDYHTAAIVVAVIKIGENDRERGTSRLVVPNLPSEGYGAADKEDTRGNGRIACREKQQMSHLASGRARVRVSGLAFLRCSLSVLFARFLLI